jgi:hypothetical protein
MEYNFDMSQQYSITPVLHYSAFDRREGSQGLPYIW